MANKITSSKPSVSFLSLAFLTSVVYSYFLSGTDRGLPLFDWFNIAIHIIWFSVLAWVAWDVYHCKVGAKSTVLGLACLVALLTGFDLFEENGSLLLASISVVEAFFLFAAYWYFPKKKLQK